MTTATVLAFPGTRTITVPVLSRGERKAELENLAEDITLGVALSPFVIWLATESCAHPSLAGDALEKAWGDFIGEELRWLAVQAGEPYWTDLEPGLAKADRDNALAVLLDGHRGDAR
jgi:hypothetical protein